MSGAVALRGRDVDVDVSASDFFSNLQFGAMGMLVAKKGNWGIRGGRHLDGARTTVRNTNVDMNQGAFAFYTGCAGWGAADVTFGLPRQHTAGRAGLQDAGCRRQPGQDLVDPIVGLSLRTAAGTTLQLRGVQRDWRVWAGSKFAWQIFPTLAFHVSIAVSLDVGYRWLDLDYSKGEGSERLHLRRATQGPVAASGSG